MTSNLGVRQFLTLVLVFTVEASVPLGLQGAPVEPAAGLLAGPTELLFEPLGDFEKAVLTVAGPGNFLYRGEFSRNEPVSFDLAGRSLADGSYTWELVLVPRMTDELRRALDEARTLDDEAALTLLMTSDRWPRGGRKSGHFLLHNSEIVLPPAMPVPTFAPQTLTDAGGVGDELNGIAAGQVINMDLSVLGKACIGDDCSANETFGPDTLRVKEVHPSLKFEDVSSNTPSNDWLVSVNGSGADTFSIEDFNGGTSPFTIVAGAPSSSLYIDEGGQVGLGTATPAADAHIVSPNTPALRLEQDSTAGLAAQTWEVAGNEDQFFIRDVTGNSEQPFRIDAGAPTSAIHVAANGNVGIGEPTPEGSLHISGSNAASLNLLLDNGSQEWALRIATNDNLNISDLTSGGDQFRILSGAPTGSLVIAANGGSVPRVGIGLANPQHPLQVGSAGGTADGEGAHVTTAGVWTNASSREFKTDIHSLSTEEAFEAFSKLEPVLYRAKAEVDGEQYVGFIAEDVPELVAMSDRKSLASMDIVGVLTRVVQMQQQQLEQLRSEAAAKDSTLVEVLERLDRLEAAQP